MSKGGSKGITGLVSRLSAKNLSSVDVDNNDVEDSEVGEANKVSTRMY